jgi:hypothetical protein
VPLRREAGDAAHLRPRALAAGAAVYADAEVERVTPLGPGALTDPRGLVGPESRPPVKRVRAVLRDRDTGRRAARSPWTRRTWCSPAARSARRRSSSGRGSAAAASAATCAHPTTGVSGFYDREIAPAPACR